MVRLQIQLEPAQHREVRRRARRLGVSVAEVIRRCVDSHLQTEGADMSERTRRALAVAGRFAEPGAPRRTSVEHDAALAKAFRQ
jgi:hypothetical protein